MSTTTVYPTVQASDARLALSEAEADALAYFFEYEIEDAPADTAADRQRIRHMLNLMDAAEEGLPIDPADLLPFVERLAESAESVRLDAKYEEESLERLAETEDTSDLWPERTLEENFALLRANVANAKQNLAQSAALVGLTKRCEAIR